MKKLTNFKYIRYYRTCYYFIVSIHNIIS
jgi:hypothetical protein